MTALAPVLAQMPQLMVVNVSGHPSHDEGASASCIQQLITLPCDPAWGYSIIKLASKYPSASDILLRWTTSYAWQRRVAALWAHYSRWEDGGNDVDD